MFAFPCPFGSLKWDVKGQSLWGLAGPSLLGMIINYYFALSIHSHFSDFLKLTFHLKLYIPFYEVLFIGSPKIELHGTYLKSFCKHFSSSE